MSCAQRSSREGQVKPHFPIGRLRSLRNSSTHAFHQCSELKVTRAEMTAKLARKTGIIYYTTGNL